MRLKRSNPKMMHRAGELRKVSTPAERRLWTYLRGNQLSEVSFRRQHAIGQYVVDFCSPRRKLVIELDGSPHLEHNAADTERTAYLVSLGYRVLRFWNSQVMNNIEGVLRAIAQALEDKEGAADT